MPPTISPTNRDAVWIERVKNRIHAQIPYWGGNGPEYAKSIAGASWLNSAKRWTYPLDLQVCRDFRSTFGNNLEIGPELWLWAEAAKGHENAMANLATQNDAELLRVGTAAPRLAEALSSRTYQRVGAAFISSGKNVLIADQPGLGKTLETLAGLIEINARRVIIFAPKTALRSVWEREIKRWVPAARVSVVTGTKQARQKIIDKFWESYQAPGDEGIQHFLICNTEMVRIKTICECPRDKCDGKSDKCPSLDLHNSYDAPVFPELFETFWDAIVCDESHLALLGRKTQVRKGFTALQSAHRIAISGTPYRGKLEKFWGVLNWLNPDVFTSYWKWAKSYFEVTPGQFGGMEIGNIMPHKQDAYDTMLKPYVLRRTKSEVAKDLPAKMYAGTPLDPFEPESTVGVWLEMDLEQNKIYHQMKQEALAHIDGGELTANGILAELIRLKQFASCSWRFEEFEKTKKVEDPITGETKVITYTVDLPIPKMPSNKFDWLLEFVEERQGTGSKVVIASQYTAIINLFAKEMAAAGHANYVLTGETKDKDRARIIAQFQDPNDPVQVFFINTMAGGVAVTLDQADELVFIDETYIPDDQEQVEDRIHRVSRMHNVTIYYLRSLGTVEETICRVTGAREAVIRRRLDGTRGVEIARKLVGAGIVDG
jgi:SNF2 family DNA or RNA helicase